MASGVRVFHDVVMHPAVFLNTRISTKTLFSLCHCKYFQGMFSFFSLHSKHTRDEKSIRALPLRMRVGRKAEGGGGVNQIMAIRRKSFYSGCHGNREKVIFHKVNECPLLGWLNPDGGEKGGDNAPPPPHLGCTT